MESDDGANELDKQEKYLADELKTFCYANGKEKKKSIKKSAIILHKLGLIYKQRSPDKVNLIQAATLINAAISRKPETEKEIKQDLQALCNHVLNIANASNTDADLIAKSRDIKRQVIQMRVETQRDLEKLKPIPDVLTKKQSQKLEKNKIKLMQNMQNKITEDYKNIMKNISEYCEEVMGEPPCEYALVGLGSIARKEITPYSDFENILLLKDGCQEWDNYENILNYFRWFAVIFQIILINLRETIIPSVCIQSLNDFTKEDGNWFYDAHTTRGVSFDGMMPHASKSPLGRTSNTKAKPWTTELIKPVSKMLKYLTEEEDLKNGYHLSDILTKTCFISGEEYLHKEFQNGQKIELQGEYAEKEVKKQTKEDLDNFSTKQCLSNLQSTDWFNVKRVIYRSTTLFISALGRLCDVNDSSCFDIIIRLAHKGEINSKARHMLMYAVALACEVRLRFYMEKRSQNDTIDSNILLKSVGKNSIISYFQIAYSLQWSVATRLNLKMSNFYSSLVLLNISICSFLGLKTTVLKLCQTVENLYFSCQKDVPQNHIIDQITSRLQNQMTLTKKYENNIFFDALNHIPQARNNLLGTVFFQIALNLYRINCYDDSLEYFNKSLAIEKKTSDDETSDKSIAVTYYNIGVCLGKMNQNDESMEYFNKSLAIRKKTSDDETSDKSIAVTYENIGECLEKMNQNDESLVYYNKSLAIRKKISEDETSDKSIAYTYVNIGECLEKMNQNDESLEYYNKSLAIKKKISDDETFDESIADTYNNIGVCLGKMNQNDESLEYFNKSLAIGKKTSDDETSDKSIAVTYYNIGVCLGKMNQNDESLEYFKKSLAIRKKTSDDETSDKSIAVTYDNIGKCLEKMNQNDESLEYYNKSLATKKKISEDETSDKSIADTYHNIGVCLQKMNQYDESLIYYNKSLAIRKKISEDETSDNGIADAYCNIGLCLLHINRYDESLEYYNKSLAIKKKISEDETSDNDIAETYGNIGVCLQKMNQNDESLEYYNKSLAIKKKISDDETSDKCIADTYHNIGVCLEKMNQNDKSLEYFNKSLAIKKKISDDETFDEMVNEMVILGFD